MNKTIEEAAREYAANVNVTSENFYTDDIPDAFTAGATHVLSLPLSQRLTDEERERVRKEYKKAYSESFEPTNCLDRQYARGRYQVLREIFGKELFGEGEGC